MNELELQKRIFKLISDPSVVYTTKFGKRLQFLSPGRISSVGPDLLEIAVLLNGFLIVGDCEIHFKSSDWILHKHELDSNYSNVILHIVMDDDIDIKSHFDTLVIRYEQLQIINIKVDSDPNEISNIEDLQNYALLRLLRKTSESQKLLLNKSLNDTLVMQCQEFISKYEQRKRRPSYDTNRLSNLLDKISNSHILTFLISIKSGLSISIPDLILNLIKHKIDEEGPHLRRELILNCVLPLALALANEENRINLFVWYWSTPTLNKYGILNRRFPNNPQNFLWQQQGMLEYLKEHGSKRNIVAESFREFGFLDVLSFYKNGRLPLEFFQD